jgi:Transposase IS4
MFSPPLGCKNLYENTRLLPIPSAIDDYNHHIGRVDIADQLRARFSTQQRRVKPWRPLFYWLLDSAIINAFRLSEHQRKAKLGSAKDKVRVGAIARRTLKRNLHFDPLFHLFNYISIL